MNPALNPNRMRIGIIGGGRRCPARTVKSELAPRVETAG
jgi:hypothetical protein